MLILALAFAAAPAQADAALFRPADPGDVTCAMPTDDVDAASVTDAVPGGIFWLRQSDFPTRLAGTLSLSTGELLGLRRTNTSVSFQAPSTALAGDTFQLLEDGDPVATLTAIAAPLTPVTAALDNAVVTASVSLPCPEKFCSDTGTVPRAATVDITYEGGPAILDVAATDPEQDMVDNTPRVVDSQLLPHVDAATTIHVLAGPGRSDEVPVDVHVRLTSVADRTILGESLLPLAVIDAPPDGTAPPACNTGNVPGGGNCAPQPFGCGSLCPQVALLFFAPLLGRRLLRRQ